MVKDKIKEWYELKKDRFMVCCIRSFLKVVPIVLIAIFLIETSQVNEINQITLIFFQVLVPILCTAPYLFIKTLDKDNILIISILNLLIITLFIDCFNIDLSQILLLQPFIIDNEKVDDIMSTLFEVQASVSTLGIALISILGGICKDTVFGISVTRYITQMKPAVFKHKGLVIFELVFMLLGYLALSIRLYNCLIAIFFVSIGMTIYMVKDIFFIFEGNSAIEEDIRDYYGDLLSATNTKNAIKEKQSIIYDISQDIRVSVNENKYIDFEKALDFLKELFVKHINSKNVSNDEKKDKVLKEFQNKIIEFSKEVFNKVEYNFTIKTIDFLIEIHKQCNDINNKNCNEENIYDKYIHLDIYDGVCDELFLSYKDLQHNNYIDLYYKLKDFRYELYDNLYFSNENKQVNNFYLKHFTTYMYQYLIKENNSDDYKYNLYHNIDLDLSCNFILYEQQKKNLVIEELCSYIITLINNRETKTISEIFCKDFNSYNEYNNLVQYKFNIIAYLYHLSECDDAKYYSSLITDVIAYYIVDICIDKYEDYNISILNTYDIISSWQINNKDISSIEDDIRCLVGFLCTYSCDEDRIQDVLKCLIKNLEREFYHTFTSFITNKDLVKKYTRFVNLFFNEQSKDQLYEYKAENDLNKLKEACKTIYKQKLVQDSIENKLNKENIKNQQEDIKQDVYDSLTETTNKFKNNTADIKTIQIKYPTVSKQLNNLKHKKLLYSNLNIKDIIVKEIIYIIQKELNKNNILFKGDEMLEDFLNKCSQHDIDTILGGQLKYNNRSIHKKYLKTDDYINYIKNINTVKCRLLNNVSVALDSSKCYFGIKNIEVKIEHCNIDDFKNNYEINNDNEHLFEGINFTKEEFEEYISNDRYKIDINFDLEYGFSDDDFGVMLLANEEKPV